MLDYSLGRGGVVEQAGSGTEGHRSVAIVEQGEGGGGSGRQQNGPATAGTPNGAMANGDARQFAREFQLRRENAEALRRDLAKQGIDTRDLDRAIENMRQLESGKPFGNPQGLEQLQAAMIEGLKTFEFGLYRSLGLGERGRPALGATAPVPAEYRAMIEEYYRSLAGDRKVGRKP